MSDYAVDSARYYGGRHLGALTWAGISPNTRSEMNNEQKIKEIKSTIKDLERQVEQLEQEPHIPGFYDPTEGDYWIDGREQMRKSPSFVCPDEHFGRRESTKERSLALMEWQRLSKPHGRCPKEGERVFYVSCKKGGAITVGDGLAYRSSCVGWLTGTVALDKGHIQKVVDHLNENPWLVGR